MTSRAKAEIASRQIEEEEEDDRNKRKADVAAIVLPTTTKRSRSMRVHWEDRIASLKAYKAQYGDLLIPIRYKQDPSLGKFVHNTREQYKLFHGKTKVGYKKKCSLTAERIAELEEIGFQWTTQRKERQKEDWERRFEQLVEYKKEKGHCLVPHGYDEDPAFAEWIHRQRTTHANMMKDGEDQTAPHVVERLKRLADLGFNFMVHQDKWMETFEELKAYKAKYGNCQVPTHFADNPRLGRWTHTQRHQRRLLMKGKKANITKERIKLLDSLGFLWEVRPAMDRPRAPWQQRYDELRQYLLHYGNFQISAIAYTDLHQWCTEQKTRLRTIHRTGGDPSKRMNPDRVELLHKIGFTKDTELPNAQVDTRKALVEKLIVLEEPPPAAAALEEMVAKAISDAAAENDEPKKPPAKKGKKKKDKEEEL